MQKHIDDLRDSIEILELNINLFDTQQRYSVYRTIAAELRKLICDASIKNIKPKNDKSLVLKLDKTFALHPIRNLKSHMQPTYEIRNGQRVKLTTSMALFGSIHISGMHIMIDNVFDESDNKLPLHQWRCQRIYYNINLEDNGISIFELIKGVADTEGAHSDPNFDKKVELFKSFIIRQVGDETIDNNPKREYIVAIAKYLLPQLKSFLSEIESNTSTGGIQPHFTQTRP